MIRSMTAYGRAEASADGKDILVEIKAVNNRYLDCSVKLPRMYGFLEEKIKTRIQNRGVSRGKVDVYVGIDVVETIGTEVLLDRAYAESYINALKALRDEFGLEDDISVMTVAANREIFNVKRPDEDLERDWAVVMPVLDEALDNFFAMREAEGENLKRDLLEKKTRIMEIAAEIGHMTEGRVDAYRARLEAKLDQLLADKGIAADPARVLTECAIFADRTAIDEELVRLQSHFKAYDEIFASSEPVGRKLDFLLQEINRETNTIGSKCSDLNLTRIVVDIKAEIEKIREQIQNIE